MESLESSKDKIKKICDILKNETLKPAQEEAGRILEIAQQEAVQMVRDAKKKGEEIKNQAKADMQKERERFEGSLRLAFKQSAEALRQEIGARFFNDNLNDWIDTEISNAEVAQKLISALVEAIEKEGMRGDLSAIIPKKVSANEVNSLLGRRVLDRLREKSTIEGDFGAGVQVKLHDRNLVLDLSEEAIEDLLKRYIAKDFRKFLFKE